MGFIQLFIREIGMNLLKQTQLAIGLFSLLSLSACISTSESVDGWMGNNGYPQWHPQTGGPNISTTGTQCYFCGEGIDTDGDGVFDHLDQCPDTPKGVEVDTKGCPLDTDEDGVPNYLDKCPDTQKGLQVDAHGCPLDSDGDGVADYLDKCPGTPKGVKVDGTGCPLDSDGDGVADYLDKCPDTPKGVKVNATGCPIDSDKDGVNDDKDKCPNTPLGAKVNAEGCWVLDNLNFDTDKADIKPTAFPILDEVVAVLKNNPNAKIEIHGHTDNKGTSHYNDGLANKRAKSVLNYLVKQWIEADRLTTAGFGLHQPIAPNDNKQGRALNRRVELKVKP